MLKFTWSLHFVILSRDNCPSPFFFFKCVNNDFSAYLNFWYLEGGCHLKNRMVCNLYSHTFFSLSAVKRHSFLKLEVKLLASTFGNVV